MAGVTLPAGLRGTSIIGGVHTNGASSTFIKKSPLDLSPLGEIKCATAAQVNSAIVLANDAFITDTVIKPANRFQRAEMLECVAKHLEGRKEELRATYHLESALPITAPEGQSSRFDIEFARTVNQLRFHANRLRLHTHFVPVIDRTSGYDIRKSMRGIGIIGLWGAINFPLAFSTAGGDFADAWASGCPVVMKAHAEHPFTSVIVGECIAAAMEELNIHRGWFSLIHGGREIGQQIMADRRIAAGALTGSLGAAKALKAIADSRGVPFYAECGSLNPVFVFPKFLAANAKPFATEYANSVCMGHGQFCTSPGLCIVAKGPGYDEFATALATAINARPAGTMLSERTRNDFLAAVDELRAVPGMSVLAGGEPVEHATQSKPVILTISGDDFARSSVVPSLEAFGHCSVVVQVEDQSRFLGVAQALAGNLTATRYGTDEELSSEDGLQLQRLLQLKAGRIIRGQMPTGVAVCAAMNHGGPFPACTINASSVGGSHRFMVEVCYQNELEDVLPRELRNSDPDRTMRLLNGHHTNSFVG